MTPLVTVRAAAKISGIGYSALKELVRSGELRSVLLPGARRRKVDLADIEALIQASKSGSNPGSSEEIPTVPKATNTALSSRSHRRYRTIRHISELPYYQKFPGKSNA